MSGWKSSVWKTRTLQPYVANAMLITWRLKEPGARHDDIIKWKYFPRYWPFVREIHRSPVNSLHKGQWRGTLMFSLICLWLNGWVNNREAGDLRRCRAHYDVNVMAPWFNSKFVQHLEWSGLKHDQPITTKDHYKMSLNYEFDWSIVNWTGAWTWISAAMVLIYCDRILSASVPESVIINSQLLKSMDVT